MTANNEVSRNTLFYGGIGVSLPIVAIMAFGGFAVAHVFGFPTTDGRTDFLEINDAFDVAAAAGSLTLVAATLFWLFIALGSNRGNGNNNENSQADDSQDEEPSCATSTGSIFGMKPRSR